MIPKIIHQTWKTAQIPQKHLAHIDSWQKKNPDWTYMFWSDRALLDFVTEHYRDFLPIYTSYQNGVMRADAGRYLLLHHFGGVYADIDCECVASFDRLTHEDRLMFCKEPETHARLQAEWRGQPYMLFNGTIASPKGHPFWLHMLRYLRKCAHSQKDVLDITGPCILTSAQLSYAHPETISVCDATMFAPIDRLGNSQIGDATLSIHHWAGSWIRAQPKKNAAVSKVKTWLAKVRHSITRGPQYNPTQAIKSVSPLTHNPAPSKNSKVAIFVPIRNGSEHVMPLGAMLANMDYPADRLRITFCEGDSTDKTREALLDFQRCYARRFSEISVLSFNTGNDVETDWRYLPKFQRNRRAKIAKVRNHLIGNALKDEDDWVLWIDADICSFPHDIITQLQSVREKIVVPNCVRTENGASFDLNNFVSRGLVKDYRYYRLIKDTLYQPEHYINSRYHLSDLRHLGKVGLDGVGGCMMLVDASLHRAGLVFPELPYCDLIETEAFGVLANDCGIRPVALPNVEVRHVPW